MLAVPGDITAREFFERFLPENFDLLSGGKVKDVDAVLQVEVEGEGTWSLTVKGGSIVVRSQADPAALAYLRVGRAAWRDLIGLSDEVARRAQGNLSGAFKFLFPEPQMVQLIKNAFQGTVEVRLKREAAEPLTLHFGFKECRPETPRTKVTMALSDWLDIAARKVVPAQLFMAGKAQVEGDVALAMNMGMLLT
jgi:putative sterol carrier protein